MQLQVLRSRRWRGWFLLVVPWTQDRILKVSRLLPLGLNFAGSGCQCRCCVGSGALSRGDCCPTRKFQQVRLSIFAPNGSGIWLTLLPVDNVTEISYFTCDGFPDDLDTCSVFVYLVKFIVFTYNQSVVECKTLMSKTPIFAIGQKKCKSHCEISSWLDIMFSDYTQKPSQR